MPKTKEQKMQIVKELAELFKKMKTAVFADFRGLKVKEITELRRLCRQQKVSYGVIKKTLIKIASREAGLNFDPDSIDGSYAVAASVEDEALPAKILTDFSKKHESLKILGGILDGKPVDKTVMLSLANLPSKPDLLSKLVGTIQAPLAGMVNALAGNLRGLLNVLDAYKNKKPV